MDSLSKLSCAIENEPGYSFIMSFILGILFWFSLCDSIFDSLGIPLFCLFACEL